LLAQNPIPRFREESFCDSFASLSGATMLSDTPARAILARVKPEGLDREQNEDGY
jgi:hypothetical protein